MGGGGGGDGRDNDGLGNGLLNRAELIVDCRQASSRMDGPRCGWATVKHIPIQNVPY